ncbi:MAG: hypothetical protein GY711_02975, partial [bacterium]|nr:hypothetical protein [bacterium]
MSKQQRSESSKRRRKCVQHRLKFGNKHGGRRKGSGRKSKDGVKRVSHHGRADFDGDQPVHVNTKIEPGLPTLRSRRAYNVIRAALAIAKDRNGMRITHFSVQSNHLHLIVEAKDRRSISQGVKALLRR